MTATGCVFVISSPSGGGKTTVVQRLRRVMPRLGRSVSVTTRARRPGERQGRDYRFVTTAAFRRLRARRELLEWAWVHGAYYGTPRGPVERALRQGRDIILAIDVQGARQIRRTLRQRVVLVFLKPPSMADLRRRLRERHTDTPQAIRRRLAAAKRELACAGSYDHVVVNDRLAQCVRQLRTIIRQYHRG